MLCDVSMIILTGKAILSALACLSQLGMRKHVSDWECEVVYGELLITGTYSGLLGSDRYGHHSL